jgi:hypothetical protein
VEKKRVRIFDRVVGGRIAEAVECLKVCSTHYDWTRDGIRYGDWTKNKEVRYVCFRSFFISSKLRRLV